MQPNTARSDTQLPRAVRRQMVRVNARMDERAAANNPAPTDPVEDPPADPTPQAPSAPGASPADVDPRHSDPSYWRSRFDNTAGVLAAVRREHVTETARLNARIAELEQTKATLETALAAAPAAPDPDPQFDVKEYFSPAEIDQYGEEQCKVMIRSAIKASVRATRQSQPPAAQPAPPAPAAAPTTPQTPPADPAKTARAELMGKLDELLPEWRDWDLDPRLHAWLAEEENGVPRQAVLNVHIANADAKKIAALYERWDRQATVAAPQPPVQPSGSGANSGGDPPPAPSRKAMTAPSSAEVKDYYKRLALGKVKDEERAQFEERLKLRHPGG
jgi:hypothetical protein